MIIIIELNIYNMNRIIIIIVSILFIVKYYIYINTYIKYLYFIILLINIKLY